MKSIEQLFVEDHEVQPEPDDGTSFTPLRTFFLLRLCWFKRQRDGCAPHLGPRDWRIRLLHKAMYSTYRDCVEQGIGELAGNVLSDHPA